MHNELHIKITPLRVTLAALFAVIFGVAALASPLVIRIGVATFLFCCVVWNCYILYTFLPLTDETDIDGASTHS